MRRTPLLGILLLAGCSTVYDATGHTPLGRDGPHVYGGVRTIYSRGGFPAEFKDTSLHDVKIGAPLVLIAPIAVDLCFPVVADTLFLPYMLTKSRSGR